MDTFSLGCIWDGAALNTALREMVYSESGEKIDGNYLHLIKNYRIIKKKTSSAELTLRIGRIGPKSSSWQVLLLN